jgi:hypothetical protein
MGIRPAHSQALKTITTDSNRKTSGFVKKFFMIDLVGAELYASA